MRRLGMFLADLVLGALLAGFLMPVLIAKGIVESRAALLVITVGCIALIVFLHGTFRPLKQ